MRNVTIRMWIDVSPVTLAEIVRLCGERMRTGEAGLGRTVRAGFPVIDVAFTVRSDGSITRYDDGERLITIGTWEAS